MEYKIPDTEVVLEKGMATIISILALHHDPKYYPEPERFDPERFNEDEKTKRHQYVYLPFREGPRICTGKLPAL
jgi:cytochrome P450 family 6